MLLTRYRVAGTLRFTGAVTLALACTSACRTEQATVRVAPLTETAQSAGSAPAAVAEEREASLTVVDVARLEAERAAPAAFEEALREGLPPATRARAALALARAEHLEAIPGLLRALRDENAVVRRHAAFGLGQLDLALESGRADHDERREAVEAILVGALDEEPDAAARHALVRALGRISVGEGLRRLVALASTGGSLQAEALSALGVSGARRDASRADDPALLAAVRAGLSAKDVEVRRAAAYAAYRQRLPLDAKTFLRARREPDAQTRIHLARALQERLGGDATPAVLLLVDPDWRVRVEAIRALEAFSSRGGALPLNDVHAAMVRAASALLDAGGRASGEVHVVTTGCRALSAPDVTTAPNEVRPLLAGLVARLGKGGAPLAPATCACAVALDALDARPDAVRRCARTWPPERVRRLEVEVAARARVSSRERAIRLKAGLSDEAPTVRAAAAWALVADGSRHAAEVAAAHLESEDDPAVAGALLSLFTGERGVEEHESVLDDATLADVVERFASSARHLEEAEPLLQAALIARERDTERARAVLAQLRAHPEPRVRELAARVPHGERAHGPRARAVPPPPLQELPLAAILHTDRGPVHLAFERELAPLAVANFAALARAGFYDGVRFHRVIPDFVAQGGDPRGDGSGGPGYTIPCENSDARFVRGAIGMALSGKDTGGSQLFLTHSDQPHLDGRYTLFARVVEGFEAMDALTQEDRIVAVQFVGAVPPR